MPPSRYPDCDGPPATPKPTRAWSARLPRPTRSRSTLRPDDRAGSHPPPRLRPGTQDRITLPQSRRPRHIRRRHGPRRSHRRLRQRHRRSDRPLRPRRVRSTWDPRQHTVALLRDVAGRTGHAATGPVPGHRRGRGGLRAGRPRAEPGLPVAWRPHRRPHGHRRRRPRPRPATRRRRRPTTHLRRLLVRLRARHHLRQPVPRAGAGARPRRRGRSDRVGHRPRR